jgi:hypothetical protein
MFLGQILRNKAIVASELRIAKIGCCAVSATVSAAIVTVNTVAANIVAVGTAQLTERARVIAIIILKYTRAGIEPIVILRRPQKVLVEASLLT